MNIFYRTILKRVFDAVFSLILLIIFTPFMIVFAVICYLYTGETPLFIQERGVTLDKRFKIYKLRTLKNTVRERVPANIFIKSYLEENVIPMGRFLRRTGIDELPQLFNILIGDMSFIGPRPLSREDLVTLKDFYPDQYKLRGQLKCTPGISGQWQIFGDRNEGAENLLKHDSSYERELCFTTDLFLVLSTIPVILLGRHSDAIIQSSRKMSHRHALLNRMFK